MVKARQASYTIGWHVLFQINFQWKMRHPATFWCRIKFFTWIAFCLIVRLLELSRQGRPGYEFIFHVNWKTSLEVLKVLGHLQPSIFHFFQMESKWFLGVPILMHIRVQHKFDPQNSVISGALYSSVIFTLSYFIILTSFMTILEPSVLFVLAVRNVSHSCWDKSNFLSHIYIPSLLRNCWVRKYLVWLFYICA